MKIYALYLAAALAVLAGPAAAQVLPAPDQLPPTELPEPLPPATTPGAEDEAAPDQPDYSRLSAGEERTVRLQGLFKRLAEEESAEDANLIAEEIWAIWLRSGSPTVDLVLRRGSDAQKRGQMKKARALFNHVLDLQPDFAEGWARSARLALEEKDFNRSLNESIQALNLEPRHFYALWTLGNAFEALGRRDEALEAYREANKLYPELKAVKDRVDALETELAGAVL